MAQYYDVSPEISPEIAVFPGDCSFKQQVALDLKKGDHLTLSSIHSTVHIGAHADAPSHYHPQGVDIASRDLNFYYGDCQVTRIQAKPATRIYKRDLSPSFSIQAPRILFRTDSFLNPNQWTNDFNALSTELIDYLAQNGVILIGIDTPSIDLAQDKVLESHQAVYSHDLAILEGLALNHVPDGVYTLTALPLKIKSGDAAPVRAVLWKK